MCLIKNAGMLVRSRFLHHIFFWLLSFTILVYIFADQKAVMTVDLLYTLSFCLILFLTVSLQLFLIIPLFLKSGRYFFFVLLSIANVVFGAYINTIWLDNFTSFLFPDYFFVSDYTYTDILLFFLVFVILSTLLKLSKKWFILNEEKQSLLAFEKDKAELHLAALRAQINPHFLFNSLNVIYSLSLKNSKETSSIVLQLSDILRYIVYDSNTDFVALDKEIGILEKYKAVQDYRIPPDLRVRFEVGEFKNEIRIPPMILLPLFENAYKHCGKNSDGNYFIDLMIKDEAKYLCLSIHNTIDGNAKSLTTEGSGMGIPNIKSRLDYLMSGRYSLESADSGKEYRLELKLAIL